MIQHLPRGNASVLFKVALSLPLPLAPSLLHATHCRFNASRIIRCKSTSLTGAAASAPNTSTNGKLLALMTKPRKGVGSLSALCGHAASTCTLLAYLNTDILALRSLAIGSGILGIAFQYYRPQPLWLPIKWGALLLFINGYMVTTLCIERYEANNMPPEMTRMYDCGDFDERGFSKVHFMRFFRLGHKRVLRKEMICREGREMKTLSYIIDGSATVTSSKDNKKIATIPSHHFIGEMAFLVYTQDYKKEPASVFSNASANVWADDTVHVWEWDANQLAKAMKDDRDLSNAFASYCSHDLREKLLTANAQICC